MKTIDLDSLTLLAGAHDSWEQGACIMEAAAYIAGEPFTDHPECVSPVIGAFLRNWNDALPDDDRQQLKRYVTEVIGTNAGPDVDVELSWMALDWLVRVQTPAWLRLAGLVDQADLLAGMAEVTPETCPSIQPALTAVRQDADAAWAAAGDAARAAAGAAAGDAAWAAAGDAAWAAARAAAGAAARAAAGDAAWDAAWDAAGAAARDAAGDADRDAARDAAWAAAGDAARAALRPTVTDLQPKAHDLVARMIAHAKAAA